MSYNLTKNHNKHIFSTKKLSESIYVTKVNSSITKLLILGIFAGAELFTGNNLIILSALDKRITWRKVFEHWGIVYIANFLGSVLIVLLIYYSGLWRASDNHV
jgi:formate/nitrite transporter FocA (FNT family)